jgi:hypothetical protein
MVARNGCATSGPANDQLDFGFRGFLNSLSKCWAGNRTPRCTFLCSLHNHSSKYTSETLLRILVCNDNNLFLYFNLLTYRLQKPITELSPEDKINTKGTKPSENYYKLIIHTYNQSKHFLAFRKCPQNRQLQHLHLHLHSHLQHWCT